MEHSHCLDDLCEWCAFLIMTSRTDSSGCTVNGEGDFALKIQVFRLLLCLYDDRLLSTFGVFTSFRPYRPCLPYLPLKDRNPFVSKGEITGADSNDHSLPPIGGALLSSASTTQHSLVVNKLATPLASVKAVLTTLTGSKIPFSIMSQYSPTLASYP